MCTYIEAYIQNERFGRQWIYVTSSLALSVATPKQLFLLLLCFLKFLKWPVYILIRHLYSSCNMNWYRAPTCPRSPSIGVRMLHTSYFVVVYLTITTLLFPRYITAKVCIYMHICDGMNASTLAPSKVSLL